ncbi:hypothetical protein H6F98_05290 [Microcoleus sp. FACHB-SPT15]|uniref:hypothetical protein n=1 Tax=Microcoleus sp. FACHB-SPT15 TaxID=2692830 RepID=UPI00177D4E12|nr:hypothetical protein [Microcoleus sp. FACHB-SPT15]MBD1804869.1 hypothetical protein [Microcoleus sp. FACHB-SPT15]
MSQTNIEKLTPQEMLIPVYRLQRQLQGKYGQPILDSRNWLRLNLPIIASY